MAQNATPHDSERSSIAAGVLPANIDDPQFTAENSRGCTEWSRASALVADLMEPLDEARASATSGAGVAASVESSFQVVLQGLGSLVSTLLSRWGH